MNYRHIFHSGNFADIAKHIILISILKKLNEKEKPFGILDAFAGPGLYNLNSSQSNRTQEAKNGIVKIFEYLGIDSIESLNNKFTCDNITLGNKIKIPFLIYEYLKTILEINKTLNNKNEIYPGSPILISNYLRKNDKFFCSELHKEDFIDLEKNLKYFFQLLSSRDTNLKSYQNYNQNKFIAKNVDGYNLIKSFIPFNEKRGLILIDPAFEKKDEFEKILSSVKLINQKFKNVITMIWYPIKDFTKENLFIDSLNLILNQEILKITSFVNNSSSKQSNGLKASSIIITNPPLIKNELEESLTYLDFIFKSKIEEI